MASARSDRLRILLIAEMCNPAWTSVPLVGYNLARALANRPELDVTLVTQIRNEPALRDDRIAQTAKVRFIDSEFVAAPIYFLAKLLRGGTGKAWTLDTASMWPSYLMFEHIVNQRYRRQLESGEFDLIHRITPLSPIFPSPLAGWTDVPMLIGPLNGGLLFPKEFPELRKREREWLKPLRSLYKLMPYYRSTWKNLAGAIAASRHTERDFPSWFRGKRFFLPENGVDPQRFPLASQWREPVETFRFITVGRLAPIKAMDLVIEAMAGSPSLRRCRLAIVGDGPERQNLEALAHRHSLGDSIEFFGWLEQAALAAEYAKSQAFVFPSLKEFGGGVVLEAMSAALPSIVVNYGGPGELVSDETGVRLPMQPRAELIVTLRREMERFADDRNLCRKLGGAAVREVNERWTWDAKASRMSEIYREVLGVEG
jgi:glycosyltransferase involved in cell wall biosynthesis